jgi:ankyrin repeat protein
MTVVFAMLCTVIYAECRINPKAEKFLRRALRSEKSALSGVVDARGMTPLGVASLLGCSSYIDDLVETGFDINALDKYNLAALCYASDLGELEVVTELLGLGADPEVPCGQYGVTALGHAASAGRAEVMKRLLQAGAWVNAQGRDGMTALCLAARANRPEIVELLLEAGADPNVVWR